MYARALRIKSNIDWTNSSYAFKPRQSKTFNYEKNTIQALEHFFQNGFTDISLKETPTKLIVKQYYYNPNYFESLPKKPNFQSTTDAKIPTMLIKATSQESSLMRLTELLEKMYQKKVEPMIIRVDYPYLNSKILAQYLAKNCLRYRSRLVLKNLFKKVPLIDNNSLIIPATPAASAAPISAKPITSLNKPTAELPSYPNPLKWNKLVGISDRFISTQLKGIRVEFKGRMTTRKAASRAATMKKSLGSFGMKTMKDSMIDYSKIAVKGKNGLFSIKVYLSSQIV
nr:2974_t:CDS:1 [Entrophospora candida]